MSLTRVNEFVAKMDKIDDLKEILLSIRSEIQGCNGCQEFRILESEAEPNQFVIVETWDCIESHRKAVECIPEEDVARAMSMLESTPDGDYYVELKSSKRDRSDASV